MGRSIRVAAPDSRRSSPMQLPHPGTVPHRRRRTSRGLGSASCTGDNADPWPRHRDPWPRHRRCKSGCLPGSHGRKRRAHSRSRFHRPRASSCCHAPTRRRQGSLVWGCAYGTVTPLLFLLPTSGITRTSSRMPCGRSGDNRTSVPPYAALPRPGETFHSPGCERVTTLHVTLTTHCRPVMTRGEDPQALSPRRAAPWVQETGPRLRNVSPRREHRTSAGWTFSAGDGQGLSARHESRGRTFDRVTMPGPGR
jgi:hypothetical protein